MINQNKSQYLNYLLVFVSHIIFMSGFIYANQSNFNPCQTNLLRGLGMTFFNFVLIKYLNFDMEFKLSVNHKYLLIRSGSICIHSLTLAFCGFYLPQPIIHTISSCGPILLIIQDYFLNGVKINAQQLKGIIITIIGVMFTINGDYILSIFIPNQQIIQNQTNFQNYATNSMSVKIGVSLFFFFIMSIWAYGTIVIKSIIELNSIQINFYMGIFLTLANGLFYPIFVTQQQPLNKMINGFFLCGLPMAIGNMIYIYSISKAKNIGIATLCISGSVFVAYFVSVFRYDQRINFICFFGSLSIIIGLGIALTAKKETQRQKSKRLNLQDNINQNFSEKSSLEDKFQLTPLQRISIKAK